ncbi:MULTISPECIES: YdcH family protein [Rhodospirillales]|nr:YdcH family protein [Rhodospirillum centenum]
MSDRHDLLHEFPEHRDRIHELKATNNHFARLFDEYHEVDQSIHRMVDNIEPACDERMEAMKRHRLHLKDELYAMMKAAEA